MFGVQITLTTHNVAYNVYTLAHAVDSSIGRNAHQVIIQNAAGTSALLFVGGPSLSSTVYGYQVLSGDSVNYEADFNGVALDGIYLLSDTDGCVVGINPQVV